MPDPEVTDEDVSNGTLTATCRIVLQCAECNMDLKEAMFELEQEITEHLCARGEEDSEHEPSVEVTNVESAERQEGAGRVKTTFYGADVTLTVKCSCGKSFPVEWHAEEKASAMDELV